MKKIRTLAFLAAVSVAPSFAAEPSSDSNVATVLQRMTQAMEAHDAVALGACFAADYRSEQPVHPARAFRGADMVTKHWAGIFQDIPDLHAETISLAIKGDTAWSEFRWSGHKRNGAAFEVRGVMVLGIAEGKIAWGRLYIEPVEQGGEDFDASAKRATR